SRDLEELTKQLLAPPREIAKPGPPLETARADVPVALDPFLLDLFRTELETHARVLEEGLVETEARRDPAKIQTLMRAAHSLKGAARIVGLDSAVRLAHAMEDMLSAAQRGERQLTGADFDLLLSGTDVFSGLAAREPTGIPAALAEASSRIDDLAKQFAQPPRPAVPPSAPPVPAAPPVTETDSPPQAGRGARGGAPSPITETVPKAPAEKAEDASVRVSVENLHRLTQTVQRIKQRHSALSNAVEQALEAMGKESMLEAQARLEEALQQAG